MLTLSLQSFMCYQSYTTSFEQGKLTLLQGKTGAGKTTLFQALTWCLFGKVRGVDRRGKATKNKRLSVRLQCPQIEVYRQKSPNSLEVLYQGQKYPDSEGQAIIEQVFCNTKLWEASSYLTERGPNPLLRLGNEDKMELLNLLAFNLEDPGKHIAKIIEALKVTEKRAEAAKMAKERAETELQAYLTQNKLTIPEGLELPPPPELEARCLKLEEELKHAKSLLPEYLKRVGTVQSLETNIHHLQKSLSAIVAIDPQPLKLQVTQTQEDLRSLQARISELQLSQTTWISRNKQAQILEELGSSLPSELLQLTPEDWVRIERSNDSYRSEARIASKLGVKYQSEIIAARIQEIEELISLQSLRKKGEKGRALLARMAELKLSLNTVQAKESLQREEGALKSEEQELTLLLAQKEQESLLFSCPHCQGKIKLTGSGRRVQLQAISLPDRGDLSPLISKLQASIPERREEIQRLSSLLAAHEQEERERCLLQSSLDDLKLKREEIPDLPPPLKEREIEKLRQELLELRSFTFPVLRDIPLSELRKYHEALNLLQTIPQSKHSHEEIKELGALEGQLPILSRSLEAYRLELSRVEKQEAQSSLYRSQLEAEKAKLAALLPTLDHKLPSKVAEIEAQLNQSREQHRLSIAQSLKSQVNLKQGELNILEERLLDLHRFKKLAFDTECQLLEAVVATINANLQTLGELFFEEPIIVELTLFRQLKSEERLKPCVGLRIAYEGEEFDGIDSLSKGEGDRISVMLTLALNMMTGSPLLLLDEAFDRLDHDTREACLEGIRAVIKNKTVLVIDHASIEGHHDKVLEVNRRL